MYEGSSKSQPLRTIQCRSYSLRLSDLFARRCHTCPKLVHVTEVVVLDISQILQLRQLDNFPVVSCPASCSDGYHRRPVNSITSSILQSPAQCQGQDESNRNGKTDYDCEKAALLARVISRCSNHVGHNRGSPILT